MKLEKCPRIPNIEVNGLKVRPEIQSHKMQGDKFSEWFVWHQPCSYITNDKWSSFWILDAWVIEEQLEGLVLQGNVQETYTCNSPNAPRGVLWKSDYVFKNDIKWQWLHSLTAGLRTIQWSPAQCHWIHNWKNCHYRKILKALDISLAGRGISYGCYKTKPTKALEPCEKAARQWHVEFKSLHLFWSDALLKHLISDDAALVFVNLWKQHADLFAVSILEKKQTNMQNHVNHVHLGHESWS